MYIYMHEEVKSLWGCDVECYYRVNRHFGANMVMYFLRLLAIICLAIEYVIHKYFTFINV